MTLPVIGDLPRPLRVRLLVTFLTRFTTYMLTPLMAIYLARHFGVAASGLLLFVVVGAAMVASIVGGHQADLHGRRPILIVSEVGVLLAFVVMTVAASSVLQSPAVTFAGYVAAMCFGGFGYPANDAVILDVAREDQRRTVYTASYWITNLAFASGATVGGLFYGRHFALLLLLGVVLSAVAAVATVLVFTETLDRSLADATRPRVADYVHVVRDTRFTRLLGAAVLITSLELELTYYVGVRLADDFGRQALFDLGGVRPVLDGVQMLSLLRFLNTTAVVVLTIVLSALLRRLSERWQLYGGLALFVLGFMGIAVARSPWLLIALTLGLTLGELLNVPVRQVILADVVPAGRRAKYLGVYALRTRVAALVATLSVAVSAVVPPAGMSLLFLVMGLAAVALLPTPARRTPAPDPVLAGAKGRA